MNTYNFYMTKMNTYNIYITKMNKYNIYITKSYYSVFHNFSLSWEYKRLVLMVLFCVAIRRDSDSLSHIYPDFFVCNFVCLSLEISVHLSSCLLRLLFFCLFLRVFHTVLNWCFFSEVRVTPKPNRVILLWRWYSEITKNCCVSDII